LGARDADLRAEFVEGEPLRHSVVTDAMAESREMDTGAAHSLSISKEDRFLYLDSMKTPG
jgi:hypothetical protein